MSDEHQTQLEIAALAQGYTVRRYLDKEGHIITSLIKYGEQENEE